MKPNRAPLAALLAAALAGVFMWAPVAAADDMLPVPAVTIYPGDTIADAMLVDRPFPAGTADTFPVAVSHGDLIGKIAKRTLLPGKPIAVNSIAVRALVQRGSVIPATYQDGNLVITASVLALEDGALNADIQARNVDSGKVIIGAVQSDGSIKVAGP